jgi:hypothetical protein
MPPLPPDVLALVQQLVASGMAEADALAAVGMGDTSIGQTSIKPSSLLSESALLQNPPVAGARAGRVPLPRGGLQPVPNPPGLDAVRAGFEAAKQDPRLLARFNAFANAPGPGGPASFGAPMGAPPAPSAAGPVSQSLARSPSLPTGAFGSGDQAGAMRQYLAMKGSVPGLGGAVGGGMGAPVAPPAPPAPAPVPSAPVPRPAGLPIGPQWAPEAKFTAEGMSLAPVATEAGPVSRALGVAKQGLGRAALPAAGALAGYSAASAGSDAYDPTLAPLENLSNVGGAVSSSLGRTAKGFTPGNMFIGGSIVDALTDPNFQLGGLAGLAADAIDIGGSAIGNAGKMAWDWANKRPGSQMSEGIDPSAMSPAPQMSLPEGEFGSMSAPAVDVPASPAPSPSPARARKPGGGARKAKPSDGIKNPGVDPQTGALRLTDQKLKSELFPDLGPQEMQFSPLAPREPIQFANERSFGGVNAEALSRPVLGEGRRRALVSDDSFAEGPGGALQKTGSKFRGASVDNSPEFLKGVSRNMPDNGLDLEEGMEQGRKRKKKVSDYLGTQYEGASKTGIFGS